ncbi:MAG: hypothetical protein U0900_04040 [Myxococcota bacterium]
MISRAVEIGILLLLIPILILIGSSAHAEDRSRWGNAEYLRYCSACHGDEADGQGPVANVLSPHPPALTSLHAKFGNPLSTRFVEFVSGTTMPRAHGTSDMPVWGQVLGEGTGEDREAVEILWKITRYLESIQKPDGHLLPKPSTETRPND